MGFSVGSVYSAEPGTSHSSVCRVTGGAANSRVEELRTKCVFQSLPGPYQVWGNSAGYTGKPSLSLGLWANRKKTLAVTFGMISWQLFTTTFLQTTDSDKLEVGPGLIVWPY